MAAPRRSARLAQRPQAGKSSTRVDPCAFTSRACMSLASSHLSSPHGSSSQLPSLERTLTPSPFVAELFGPSLWLQDQQPKTSRSRQVQVSLSAHSNSQVFGKLTCCAPESNEDTPS
ncbi:predicted protein [Coccidioides posadasii str. Silveira]|uniref:Predicted protein n=1 Tax=Coccidioides posadasii (strain RMSCC 757 / Silveira) TaxID=443226 RepID=E9CS90_COCPS|nr:predicted protein [Coccidioides posadasii str. Silveira]